MPVDCLDLAAALADALEAPLPSIGLPRRLWLLGTGSHHDAAELVTHLFAGTGRSCRAISSDGHAQLSGLVGPADTVVLVGPPEDEFLQLGHRVATGAGALVVELREQDAAHTDSTTRHLTAAMRLARIAISGGAIGAKAADLDRIPGAVAAVAVNPELPEFDLPERALLVTGSGPAAVTARHAAVAFRASGVPAEGVDATDLLGGLVTDLGADDTVIILDAARDVESSAASLSRLAGALGTTVIKMEGPAYMPAVCAQFPLAARLNLLAR
jgi:DNA-binding MurR/RpiR family transcriptional regulator